MPDPFRTDPPAVVRERCTYEEDLVAAEGLCDRVVVDFIELVHRLDSARSRCPANEWEAALKRHHFNPSTVRTWRQRAKELADNRQKPRPSQRDGVSIITGPDASDDVVGSSVKIPQPAQNTLFHATPQTDYSNGYVTDPSLCRFCNHRKSLGRQAIKDCPDCVVVRGESRQAPKPARSDAPRPPGTSAPAPAQSGTKPSPTRGEKSPGGLAGAGSVDREGHPIPTHCREAFEQRDEVMQAAAKVQEVIDTLPNVIGKPGWVWVDTGEAGHHLKEARDIIQGGAVEHLCPNCASKPGGCPLCMGRPGVPHRIWKD